jgi:hypothetical protein
MTRADVGRKARTYSRAFRKDECRQRGNDECSEIDGYDICVGRGLAEQAEDQESSRAGVDEDRSGEHHDRRASHKTRNQRCGHWQAKRGSG